MEVFFGLDVILLNTVYADSWILNSGFRYKRSAFFCGCLWHFFETTFSISALNFCKILFADLPYSSLFGFREFELFGFKTPLFIFYLNSFVALLLSSSQVSINLIISFCKKAHGFSLHKYERALIRIQFLMSVCVSVIMKKR